MPHKCLLPLLLPMLALPVVAAAQDMDFQQCQNRWMEQVSAHGLDKAFASPLIAGLAPIERVLELDRQQPEFTSSFGHYLERRLTDSRIEKGQVLLQKHADLLAQLTRRYGIPGRILVAFWGLETNYGGYLGNMPTLNALATLACDERRSRYFTGELLQAIRLVQVHDLNPGKMRGSWAGAMGQTQFMPSNYHRYGVDGDGDGKIDLWNSVPDALHSAANFLHQLGWESGLRWGREVQLPDAFDYALAGLKQPRPLREWADLGVLHAHGGALPVADVDAALLVPAGHTGPAFLVYQNFRTIMRWNNSESYALSVGLLADRLIGAGPLTREPEQLRISLDRIREMQNRLNELGFDAGTADGIVGPGTRSAIRAFQQSRGMIPDGYHSADLLRALGVNGEKDT